MTVGAFDGFGGSDDFKAFFLRDRNGLAAFVKADDDLEAAVFEVERVGVALRTEAEDRQRFVFQHAEVGVFVMINFCNFCHKLLKRTKRVATRMNTVNLQLSCF